MKTESQIVLPDGRNLAYAEFGQPDGEPGTRFECHWRSSMASRT